MADKDIYRDEDRNQNPTYNPVFHRVTQTVLKTPLVIGQYWLDTDNSLKFQSSNGIQSVISSNDGFITPKFAELIDNVGGQNLNTNNGIIMTWGSDGELFETNYYSKPNNQTIRVLNNGLYKINFSISAETTNNRRKTPIVEIRVNGNSIIKSRSYSFTRNNTDDKLTVSLNNLLLNLNINDDVTVYGAREGDSGNLLTLAEESYFNIELVRLN